MGGSDESDPASNPLSGPLQSCLALRHRNVPLSLDRSRHVLPTFVIEMGILTKFSGYKFRTAVICIFVQTVKGCKSMTHPG